MRIPSHSRRGQGIESGSGVARPGAKLRAGIDGLGYRSDRRLPIIGKGPATREGRR